MTSDQIKSVKSSWALVILTAEEAGNLFYKRLFEIAPEVRPMFKHNITAREKKWLT
ncbi:MAG: hypothetical protein H7329_14135 [Opitutaceae bacterium]|nr:hypothetical protein [Cytophagales bacterium]